MIKIQYTGGHVETIEADRYSPDGAGSMNFYTDGGLVTSRSASNIQKMDVVDQGMKEVIAPAAEVVPAEPVPTPVVEQAPVIEPVAEQTPTPLDVEIDTPLSDVMAEEPAKSFPPKTKKTK